MKKSFKRLVAIVAAVAMTVTGITFTPSDVSAAWTTATFDWSVQTAGMWTYKGGNYLAGSYDGASTTQVQGLKWNFTNGGEALYAWSADLTNINCVAPKDDGTGTYTKPTVGKEYEVHAAFTYSSSTTDYTKMVVDLNAGAGDGNSARQLYRQDTSFNKNNTSATLTDASTGEVPVITMPDDGLYFKENLGCTSNPVKFGWAGLQISQL